MSAMMSTGSHFNDPHRCLPVSRSALQTLILESHSVSMTTERYGQMVIFKDAVACPSCLHDGDCGSPRKDEAVCCKNGNWDGLSQGWPDGLSQIYCPDCGELDQDQDGYVTRDEFEVYVGGYGVEPVRSCHDAAVTEHVYDAAQPSDGYERYNTCESACRAATLWGYTYSISYYPNCKNPDDGAKTPLMTDNPTSTNDANHKKWCECVETCIRCTGANGGTGERYNQWIRRESTTTINPAYMNVHGTCAPQPARWILPPITAAPAGTPAPAPVEAVDFICDAATAPGTILLPLG